ncbi:MAG TPA: glycosyltransferase [Chthoniobacteraceae bacterium]|jgi:GT2 family glycosyltransferase
MKIGVCITTHNRREELARTLRALQQLTPPADELLVCADGCSDGTVEWLQAEHPGVRLIEHAVARGSIPSRNELARECTCDVFLSLDDDSYPLEADIIERVSTLFATHPRLAVASFPQRSDEFPETLTATDFGQPQFTGSYANSGAAVRRSAFLKLGGYPDFFFHAYEEPDFALRCVANGWQVRHETSLTIRHHFTSAQRNELRTHHRHSRNELWSVLLRCPAPQVFAVALFRVARQAGYARKRGLRWLLAEPKWWLACLSGLRRCLASRQPLPWPRYLAWMQLSRAPLVSEAEWNARFGNSAA